MGRYVRGTHGFECRYVFGEQPDNAGELPDLLGIARPEPLLGLRAQYFAFDVPGSRYEPDLVDGVGELTCVYGSDCPPLGLGPDPESAIYQVCEQLPEILDDLDRHLPGPAFSLQLVDRGVAVTVTRAQWPVVARAIGSGADPARPESVDAAAAALFEAGDQLRWLAARILHHAVVHDLPVMEVFDHTAELSSNLWSVAEETPEVFESGWLTARVHMFQHRPATAVPLLRQLLAERPSALPVARALFAALIWDGDWDEVGRTATRLLGAGQAPADRAELLCWRGDAAWTRGDPAAARRDGAEAAVLGRSELLDALNRRAPTA